MKTILKINKIYILLLFYLFCSNLNLYAQITTFQKDLYFTVKYEDCVKFLNDANIGVKGNGDGKTIKISVFAEDNYAKEDGLDSDSFLYGFKSFNLNNDYRNESIKNITRTAPTADGDTSFIAGVYPSNDLSYFKKRITKITGHRSYFNFNSLKDDTVDLVVRIEVIGLQPTLASVTGIKLVGINEFNPNDVSSGTIYVYRGDPTTPVQTLQLNSQNSSNYNLVTYQGDKVVFEANTGTIPNVANLTDTNVMRWAGECIFMKNKINNLGEIKPFLFFDSNVHGVKMRKYPSKWDNPGEDKYPDFVSVASGSKLRLTWIANGRFDFTENVNTAIAYNINQYLTNYKVRANNELFPNSNKFFGTPSASIGAQRNNQKEGLNMELLDAFTDGKNFVAGLDPDELIYKAYNKSDIVGNNIAGKIFNYVADDQWKIIPIDQRGNINSAMSQFLTKTGRFRSQKNQYEFNGEEIIDNALFIKKTGSTTIEGKTFDYSTAQPMFNDKIPVYYNDVVTNKPRPATNTLKFSISGRVFNVALAVLSPLEGKRIGKAYNNLSDADRKNPQVNFYGIIDGPTHVARFQQNVKYSVANLPTDAPGVFTLVYTYEDSYGILTEQRQVVSSALPSFTIDFKSGGYHDITLRYKRDPLASNDDEVIIAGKELIDIDLRFIFSPNAEDAKDFSFNPSTTFGNTENSITSIGGNVRLNENKANGKYWFLESNNESLSQSNGYKNGSVVRTYTLDRDEVLPLTVLDADPHSFVHYQPDFYLSERRLSKRLTDADLKNASGDSKIEWFVAKDEGFTDGNRSIGFGRYYSVSPKVLYAGGWFNGAYKGAFYIKAVYNNTSEIKVKIVQKEYISSLDGNVDIGSLGTYNLNQNQFNFLQTIAPAFYTGTSDQYKIYKIQDLLSSFVYGQKNSSTSGGTVAKRYIPSGMTTEVGEDKRFSEQNNYDARFSWTFRKPSDGSVINNTNLFFDFTTNAVYNSYVTNYLSKWFPSNWVRHLDSPLRSPEIPDSNDSEYNAVKVFNENQTATIQSYNNTTATLYEPWQVRLPWMSKAGVHGYKTRWNIKCIYDINKLFNRSQIGIAYNLSENSATYAGALGSVIPNYDNLDKENQEFFTMLKNKEIVVVKESALTSTSIKIKVVDFGNVTILDGTFTTPTAKLAQSKKNELSSLIDDNNGLCKVYPNPNSLGIFKVEINVPQENSQIELQLSDLTGKILFTSVPKIVNSSYSTIIGENLRLQKGVYLLSIKVNDVQETKKLIVD